MNELEIIKKCIEWNLDNFWIIYDKYIDKIYRFVYLKTNNKEVGARKNRVDVGREGEYSDGREIRTPVPYHILGYIII